MARFAARLILLLTGCLAAPLLARAALPAYHFDIRLDPDRLQASVVERVAWTNPSPRPAESVVFNVFAAHKLPLLERAALAKLLEIERLAPHEALDPAGAALHLEAVSLPGAHSAPLRFEFGGKYGTVLEVPLPRPLRQGETVVLDLEFTLRLPQRMGRWGVWDGVVSLATWYPVLAVYGDGGWVPTPFVPWHPAIHQEAARYRATVVLPAGWTVACTCPLNQATEAESGQERLEFRSRLARDFALIATRDCRELTAPADGVALRCLVRPGHEAAARIILRGAARAVAAFATWFGPYPYPELTIIEAYPGAGGSVSCSGVLLIDSRFFTMPCLAAGMIEIMITQQVCRQWWSGVIGVDGYSEAWLDEGQATFFAHRLLDRREGCPKGLLDWPDALSWLPQLDREAYGRFNLLCAAGRGEAGATLQPLSNFGHASNYIAMICERGSGVLGMIEARLGHERFLEFVRRLFARYPFHLLRVADYRRELEDFTGAPWGDFFTRWLERDGWTDWAVEAVGCEDRGEGRCLVRVSLGQHAEYDEPTVLGIQLPGRDDWLRIPLDPKGEEGSPPDVPMVIRRKGPHEFEVELELPCRPEQVTVDPDRVLLDRDPANNAWKPAVRFHVTPLATPLDETELTCACDRWNVVLGPWVSDTAYNDPWFAISGVAGVRLAAFRTEQFSGGVYAGYRDNYGDLCAGVDALWSHCPLPCMQIGFGAEKRLSIIDPRNHGPDRAILFGRYVFEETDRLTGDPMHYAQVFVTTTDNPLPPSRQTLPGTERPDAMRTAGLSYHLDLMTPYWDPEFGARVDASYSGGLAAGVGPEVFHQASAQLAAVVPLPGWLAYSRLAGRIYGGAALPDRLQLFTLGGSQLFRGFDLAQRQGSAVWVASAEWRLPIVRDRCWGLCDHAAVVRAAWLAPFYDVGAVYSGGRLVDNVAHAVGVGLRVEASWLGFLERSTLRFDVARPINVTAPVQFWFGLEHPF